MRVTRTGKAINTGTDADRRYRDIGSRRHAKITEQNAETVSRRNTYGKPGKELQVSEDVATTQTQHEKDAQFYELPKRINVFRCNSAFLAHLIGIKENAAHLRDRRRVEPEEGAISYTTTEKAPRLIGEGRIIEYNA
ncbi:hypothetical protein PsAD13_00159 [Pseudovibrio sp. Ad13]|uniref:hypothetical protein n=1 Tax=unclassified Pseudovibrio TaxID=2627060 RepID=UPI0007AEB745|nr:MULTISPECIES: hypothetical protein [unclassified Pseudovibrio]KZK88210.1 hypothetical protein PsAD13_00159 [Pseudovibrio sp. Ad13]KZK99703.1 hypothetical protein PsW74_02303 [Pseudovibrio sp. W74]KZL11995.1 hypothetical protein PsAD14_00161 [Pseudovibrio sp. Ad14]KZL17000.1 hypothetical protein PsAD26_00159 [Pseudovibrio sp. Ad26]